MATFLINLQDNLLKVGFNPNEPAQNDQIVKDAETRLDEMVAKGELVGGSIIKVNGPASLPVAMAICHAIAHIYEVVACFDPKLAKYVVAVSHSPAYRPGDLID